MEVSVTMFHPVGLWFTVAWFDQIGLTTQVTRRKGYTYHHLANLK